MYSSEKISVIIPVYNTEKYLETSVRSVMEQTYRNLEIICVNDGSTDGSLKILEKLKAEDERIMIVDKENGGLGDARNAGLKRAGSEWISFIDSDDTFRKDTFEIASKAMACNPDMIHFGIEIVTEDETYEKHDGNGYYTVPYSGLMDLNDKDRLKLDFSACNKIFRKSVLDKYDIHFEKIHYEDYPFVMQYRCMIEKVYYLQDKLYYYLRRQGSIMANTFNGSPHSIDHLYAFESIAVFLQKQAKMERYGEMMALSFSSYYILSLKYAADNAIPSIVKYAEQLYDKYDFLNARLKIVTENGTMLFRDRLNPKKHSIGTRFLQSIVSVRPEFIDYRRYKIVRLFGIIVYKKRLRP